MSLSIFEKWSTIEVSIRFKIEQRNGKLTTEESPNFDANGLTFEKSNQCYKIVYIQELQEIERLVDTFRKHENFERFYSMDSDPDYFL
jgi:hypothetical protein